MSVSCAASAHRRIARPATRAMGGLVSLTVLLAGAGAAHANKADVVAAKADCNAVRGCTFDVTVRHADVGRGHYADRWEVLGPAGEILGTRVLQHPHVHEQPFERRLVGVNVPPGINVVTIRAHDSVHGYGGRDLELRLYFPDSSVRETPKQVFDNLHPGPEAPPRDEPSLVPAEPQPQDENE